MPGSAVIRRDRATTSTAVSSSAKIRRTLCIQISPSEEGRRKGRMLFSHFAPPCVRPHPYGRESMQLHCNVIDPGVVSEEVRNVFVILLSGRPR